MKNNLLSWKYFSLVLISLCLGVIALSIIYIGDRSFHWILALFFGFTAYYPIRINFQKVLLPIIVLVTSFWLPPLTLFLVFGGIIPWVLIGMLLLLLGLVIGRLASEGPKTRVFSLLGLMIVLSVWIQMRSFNQFEHWLYYDTVSGYVEQPFVLEKPLMLAEEGLYEVEKSEDLQFFLVWHSYCRRNCYDKLPVVENWYERHRESEDISFYAVNLLTEKEHRERVVEVYDSEEYSMPLYFYDYTENQYFGGFVPPWGFEISVIIVQEGQAIHFSNLEKGKKRIESLLKKM